MAPLRRANEPTKQQYTRDRKRMNDSVSTDKPIQIGWEPELAELRQRQALAREMGGKERVERQHKGGRLTVRERIDHLLDPGTFKEIGSIAGKATYDGKGNIRSEERRGGKECRSRW